MPSRYKTLRRQLPAILTTAILSTPIAANPGDTAYINGKVLTVDDTFSVAEAFTVRGGRFLNVGSNDEITEHIDDDTRVVDLNGRTVVPGLIDNHNHFVRGAQHWKSTVRFDGVTSRKQALELLKQKEQSLGAEEWLLVLGGWHNEQFIDGKNGFTLEELDVLSKKRPVFIQASYDHAYVNTAFYKHIGIALTEATGVAHPRHPIFGPSLASLVQRDGSGKVTSLLNGGIRMVMQVGMRMPKVSPAQSLEALREAQAFYHSLGITTVYDPAGALINETSYAAVEELHKRGELTVRTFRTKWIQPHDEESTAQAVTEIEGAGPFFAGDDFYDLLALGEAIYVPVHDAPGEEPHFNEEARKAVSLILETSISLGHPLQIHAVNTSTLAFYLDIIEPLATSHSVYPGQISFTHAEGADSNVLRRIQRLGASLQIRSAAAIRSRGGLAEKTASDKLGQPQLRLISDSGVLWGLGTDGTKAGQINPMTTLSWAITGQAINGDKLLPASQRLNRREALIAHTRNNAQLVARGNVLGQIRPGFAADFVVLDTDYLTVKESEIGDIHPVLTVVAGDIVFKN